MPTASTIRLKRSALLALAEFANPAKSALEADDYSSGVAIRVTPEHIRLAASNRAVLAVANLEVGAPDEALAFAADLWGDGSADEYILPINKVLPALKGNPDDEVLISHEVYGNAAAETRGLLTIIPSEGYTIRVSPIPSLFKHLETLTTVSAGELLASTQVSLAPALLVKFVRAAKRLGIPNPERVVLAFTGPNSPMGVKAGLTDWFFGVLLPMTAPTRYEGTAPGWVYDLTDEEADSETDTEPELEEVAQLTWDFESLPPMDMQASDADLDELTEEQTAQGDADADEAFSLADLPSLDECEGGADA